MLLYVISQHADVTSMTTATELCILKSKNNSKAKRLQYALSGSPKAFMISNLTGGGGVPVE